jgi:[acyl-carrier-protein] S-malonyltransferase
LGQLHSVLRPGTCAKDPAEIKKNLIIQLTAPVKWTQSVQQMIADGATLFTEVGPGKY